MSKHLTPCLYKGRALENQWKNTIFNTHDLFCGCDNPLKHLKAIIEEECLPFDTTTTDGDHKKDTDEKEDFILDDGDLQQLFDAENADSG